MCERATGSNWRRKTAVWPRPASAPPRSLAFSLAHSAFPSLPEWSSRDRPCHRIRPAGPGVAGECPRNVLSISSGATERILLLALGPGGAGWVGAGPPAAVQGSRNAVFLFIKRETRETATLYAALD